MRTLGGGRSNLAVFLFASLFGRNESVLVFLLEFSLHPQFSTRLPDFAYDDFFLHIVFRLSFVPPIRP